ncbi:MAG TPA: hypothetical protein VE548_01320 [Nitrososphaeraceae archaeon]|jgi:hypothetical protein|nr:hypothetical protein [Nitrososphaeraceae archaeon]
MSEKEDEEEKNEMSSASESFPCYTCNQNFPTQSAYDEHSPCTADNVA